MDRRPLRGKLSWSSILTIQSLWIFFFCLRWKQRTCKVSRQPIFRFLLPQFSQPFNEPSFIFHNILFYQIPLEIILTSFWQTLPSKSIYYYFQFYFPFSLFLKPPLEYQDALFPFNLKLSLKGIWWRVIWISQSGDFCGSHQNYYYIPDWQRKRNLTWINTMLLKYKEWMLQKWKIDYLTKKFAIST